MTINCYFFAIKGIYGNIEKLRLSLFAIGSWDPHASRSLTFSVVHVQGFLMPLNLTIGCRLGQLTYVFGLREEIKSRLRCDLKVSERSEPYLIGEACFHVVLPRMTDVA